MMDIKNILKKPLVFYILTLLFLETILCINVFQSIDSSFVYILLFDISFAFFITLLSTLWNKTINKWIIGILLGLLCLYFTAQILYYDFFKVFLSVYSIGNGGQVADFYKDIIQLIINNVIWIIICFIPLITYIIINKKLDIEKLNRKSILIHCATMIIAFITGYSLLYIPSDKLTTPKDIYKESIMNVTTVDQFGMITSLRLDIQSLIIKNDVPLDEPIINEEPETVYQPNIMNIDFDTLINNTENTTIKNMHQYFNSVTPTSKNEYTGMFEGNNLILITAEAFSPYAIDKDVTPTLYKLANEGFQFTNFYTPLWNVSTSDGEYVALQGLIPKAGTWSFRDSSDNYLPFTMGKQFEKLGYTTNAYHNHSYKYYGRDQSHPNMGYNYTGIGNGMNIKSQWPRSDLEMMQVTVDDYINEEHFHTYYMTVSGHTNYDWNGNSMASKNKKLVSDLDYSELAKGYLATQKELDKALEYLINRLEEKGILDKTLIAISADHYPYGLPIENYNELAGKTLEQDFELYENEFIIWSSSMTEPIVVDKLGCSLDIIPTLSNLLGLEYDSRLLMGTDLLSDSEPLVIFENKSFITDKVRYNARTGEVTWYVEEDQEYLKKMNNIVKNKIQYSKLILDNDYYRIVFNNDND